MTNPYTGLPDRSYWRTAVATTSHLEIKDLYRKKFDISPNDVVATAGSCFAQHIGRQLRLRNLGFVDFEPPPAFLDEAAAQQFGYLMYSARYGNVYTVRQLKQLFLRAFDEFHPEEDCWEHNGRFYDPFRPSIEPNGFGSPEEMRMVRAGHLAAVRRLFEQSSIFVFTLGLTEAWLSQRDGAVFPTCPGTVAGNYDSSKHQFRNFTYPEILEDMNYVIARVREINPTIRFLLTVSPVPLTATASSEHILSANAYSKSVLRAVAGDVFNAYPFVDYFPSYEIIAATSSRAMFYEPNLRSVATTGVNHVMSYFFGQHSPPPTNIITRDVNVPGKSALDVVCDEEKLDILGVKVGK